jgi:hypothetical protein
MTRMFDRAPWRASNSNVSPDGKWLAFMVNTYTSAPGFGMGLGLMNLEEWEKSVRPAVGDACRERRDAGICALAASAGAPPGAAPSCRE